MKFLSGHLAYALRDEQLRRNLGSLLRYVAVLGVVIAVYSVLFHVVMLREGQDHSWITGIYWTLTVMSTLGFGDITFTSDLGRLFSVLVLLSGIVLLLIVLPFAFIRYFYAPWLEARLKMRAPRTVPDGVSGHVIFTAWDETVGALGRRLEADGVPWHVIEEDPTKATTLHADGVPVVRGAVDDVETYRALGTTRARMVVLNRDDLTNTNVALTVGEACSVVPVAAIAEHEHSVDILQLSGCAHVLHLKRRLGEQLANRVCAGLSQVHVIASYRDLLVGEFPVHGTPLEGRTLGESRLREIAGVNVAGVWDRAEMLPPRPDTLLSHLAEPVVVGSPEAIERLDEYLVIYDTNVHPVVVIGGGEVGRSAAAALAARDIPVHLLEREASAAAAAERYADRIVVGDAADREVMREVGIEEAPSIILTTNDDATNIYLAAYCRRLNPDARILSRITHDRNLAAIQRAGADLTLSYTTLATETIFALFNERPPIVLGAGVAFHYLPCPGELVGATLRESGVGEHTGLTVVAIEEGDVLISEVGPETRLGEASTLLTIGTDAQVADFRRRWN
jgi:Trk K+ transport system NAD-binding subunit